MRHILLVILLITANNNAIAEWIMVGGNEADSVYADPASIIRTFHKVKMRSLHDFRTSAKVSGNTFLSADIQQEYDCQANKSRTLVLICYSKNMGKGRIIFSDIEAHDWEPANFGSIRQALLKFACMQR